MNTALRTVNGGGGWRINVRRTWPSPTHTRPHAPSHTPILHSVFSVVPCSLCAVCACSFALVWFLCRRSAGWRSAVGGTMGGFCSRPDAAPVADVPPAVGNTPNTRSGAPRRHAVHASTGGGATSRATFAARDGVTPLARSNSIRSMAKTLAVAAKAADEEEEDEEASTGPLYTLKTSSVSSSRRGKHRPPHSSSPALAPAHSISIIPAANLSAKSVAGSSSSGGGIPRPPSTQQLAAPGDRRKPSRQQQPKDLIDPIDVGDGNSVAPRSALANMLKDDEDAFPRPPRSAGTSSVGSASPLVPGNRRASLQKSTGIIFSGGSSTPRASPPSTPRLAAGGTVTPTSPPSPAGAPPSPQPAGKRIITVAANKAPSPKTSTPSRGTAAGSNAPSAAAAASSSASSLSLGLAQEKAELLRRIKEMQAKNDAWIASMEAKQTPEAQAAERAALIAHRDTVIANRAAAAAEQRASLEQQMTELVHQRYDAFLATVNADRLAADLKTGMERQARRMKEEEAKRQARRTAADAMQLASSPTLALEPASPTRALDSYTAPFTPLSKAAGAFSSASSSSAQHRSGGGGSGHSDSSPIGGGATLSPADIALTAALRASGGVGADGVTPLSLDEFLTPGSPRVGNRSPSRSKDEVERRKARAEANALKRASGKGPIDTRPGHRTNLSNHGLPPSPSMRIDATTTSTPDANNTSTPTRVSHTPAEPKQQTHSPAQQSSNSPHLLSAPSSPSTQPRRSIPSLASLQAELTTAEVAEARCRTLEAEAAKLPDGAHAKQLLLIHARMCGQVAAIRRLEESTAKKKSDIRREQRDMHSLVQQARDAKEALALSQQTRRTLHQPTTVGGGKAP